MADLDLAEGPDGRRVVIKRVRDLLRDDDAFVERFLREARIASRLEHPNIVKVLDTGASIGEPYLVMEHLEGLDLAALLSLLDRDGERANLGAICVIAADVARGLHYAHTLVSTHGNPMRIVHRDVSPRNLFVTTAGVTKVLDFGIARSALGTALSRAGEVRGTWGYMAPEQLSGLALDARTDLFALGVVLWEMLTMRRLFAGGDDATVIRAIQQESAMPPSMSNVEVPRMLDAIVLSMLAKLPSGRPPEAQRVAEWLDEIARTSSRDSDPREAVVSLVARFRSRTDRTGGRWDEGTTDARPRAYSTE
jgi:serine/threonine protein kinase